MGSRIFRAKILALQTNLLNFAYTLTSNRDDAYDLLQDTTLKALTSEDKYVDNVNFKGWIFTIMRNLFINNYRKQMRSVVVVDQSDDLYQLNATASETDNPEDSLNTREINDAISAIPPEYGEPLSLFRLPLRRNSETHGTAIGNCQKPYFPGSQTTAEQAVGHTL